MCVKASPFIYMKIGGNICNAFMAYERLYLMLSSPDL